MKLHDLANWIVLAALALLLGSCGAGKSADGGIDTDMTQAGRLQAPADVWSHGDAGAEDDVAAGFGAAAVGAADELGTQSGNMPDSTEQPLGSSELDIDSALREIAALESPAGVDNEVFAELQAELGRLLAQPDAQAKADRGVSAKRISRPSPFPTRIDHASRRLQLLYLLEGDYDQNGVVNAADIIPLAVHFGEMADEAGEGYFELGSIPYIIDTRGDGMITLADLTAIARNFGNQLEAYDVYASEDLAEVPYWNAGLSSLSEGYYLQEPGGEKRMELKLADARASERGQLLFEVEVPGELVSYYWVGQRSSLEDDRYGSAALAGDIFSGYAAQLSWFREKETQLRYDINDNSVTLYPVLMADGDRNGTVTIGDLTPLGVQLHQEPFPEDPPGTRMGADYNNDGIVSLADLVGVASCLSASIDGYRLFYASSVQDRPAGYWDLEINPSIQEFDYSEDVAYIYPSRYGMTHFTLPFTPASGSYLYLRPYLGEELGPVCEFVEIE